MYSGDLKSRLVLILNGQMRLVCKLSGLRMGSEIRKPNHLKTRPFEIWTFLLGFQMVFDKMVAICLDPYSYSPTL